AAWAAPASAARALEVRVSGARALAAPASAGGGRGGFRPPSSLSEGARPAASGPGSGAQPGPARWAGARRAGALWTAGVEGVGLRERAPGPRIMTQPIAQDRAQAVTTAMPVQARAIHGGRPAAGRGGACRGAGSNTSAPGSGAGGAAGGTWARP